MDAEDCFFKEKISSCPGSKQKLSNCGRIQKIIEASELRGHTDIHDSLKASFASGSVTNIKCHKNCISSYISAHNIASLAQKWKTTNSTKLLPKKLRSETKGLKFDF